MSAGIAGHCDYLLDNVIHASVSEIALQIEYLIAWYNKSNSLIAKTNLQSRCTSTCIWHHNARQFILIRCKHSTESLRIGFAISRKEPYLTVA